MWNKRLFTFLRYYALAFIIMGIVIKNKNITNSMVILILIFIINNQFRFFSLENMWHKIISFIIELMFISILYKWIYEYIIFYLVLEAIDSNVLFKRFVKNFFNVVIIFMGIYASLNEKFQFKLLMIGLLGIIIALLYFMQDENDKKLKAQELYDELKISEGKLVKANKDLEVYASSIEELTLLKERNRLSREIHDSVGHALSAIVVQLGAIQRIISKNSDAATELTRELKKFVQSTLNDVRVAVREIKPKEYEAFEGILMIQELIKNFKKLTGVDVRLAFTKEKWTLNSEQSSIIYRIIQEFLSNSLRHGKATSIQIFMAFSEYTLSVTLKDNGNGAERIVEGVGLKGMRERVAEAGGTFEYNTAAGEGFLVKVELNKKEKPKIYSQGEYDEKDKGHIS